MNFAQGVVAFGGTSRAALAELTEEDLPSVRSLCIEMRPLQRRALIKALKVVPQSSPHLGIRSKPTTRKQNPVAVAPAATTADAVLAEHIDGSPENGNGCSNMMPGDVTQSSQSSLWAGSGPRTIGPSKQRPDTDTRDKMSSQPESLSAEESYVPTGSPTRPLASRARTPPPPSGTSRRPVAKSPSLVPPTPPVGASPRPVASFLTPTRPEHTVTTLTNKNYVDGQRRTIGATKSPSPARSLSQMSPPPPPGTGKRPTARDLTVPDLDVVVDCKAVQLQPEKAHNQHSHRASWSSALKGRGMLGDDVTEDSSQALHSRKVHDAAHDAVLHARRGSQDSILNGKSEIEWVTWMCGQIEKGVEPLPSQVARTRLAC